MKRRKRIQFWGEDEDVTGFPRLLGALREHGPDDDALRKLTHENWIRVLRDIWND